MTKYDFEVQFPNTAVLLDGLSISFRSYWSMPSDSLECIGESMCAEIDSDLLQDLLCDNIDVVSDMIQAECVGNNKKIMFSNKSDSISAYACSIVLENYRDNIESFYFCEHNLDICVDDEIAHDDYSRRQNFYLSNGRSL